MKRYFVLIPVLVFLLLPGPAAGFTFEGPLQVRNQFPIFLPANQHYFEKASTEKSLSLSLSHSSVYVIEDSAQWSARLDIELTELNIRFKKDIPGIFEIGLDIPVLRATGGFMDRPLAWYHRASGFGDYGRTERPQNHFLYDIKKDGMPLIEGNNDKTGFSDVRLAFKKKIIDGRFVAGVLADVEFPTGNARVGYGNGSLDTGFALLLDYDLRDDARLYGNLGVVFPGNLKALQTADLSTFYYSGAGMEYFAWPAFSLLAQVTVQTSPWPKTGISQIDTPAILLVLGGRYYVNSGSFEFSLAEDPNTSGAPDFILNLSCKKRF